MTEGKQKATPRRPAKKIETDDIANISKRYLEPEELRDTPARLFRTMIKDRLNIGVNEWGMLLRDWLDWVITTKDRDKARAERINMMGNIKETFFHTPTLTWGKLMQGLMLIKMRKVEIILRATDKDGNVHEVSEELKLPTVPTKQLEEPKPRRKRKM